MKCEFEKRVYLYDVLDDREKADVGRHLASCPACRELQRRLFYEHDIVRKASRENAVSYDASYLTDRIMKAVSSVKSRVSFYDRLLYYFDASPVRYALGVLSSALVIFFLIESNRGSATVEASAYQVFHDSKETATLNSSAFRQELQRKRELSTEGASLYSCIKTCYTAGNLRRDCSECESIIEKMREL